MRFSSLSSSIKKLGVASTLKLLISKRRLRRFLPDCTQTLYTRVYRNPIHFRHGTTDRYVVEEVLIAEQYATLRGMKNVSTIVDAGANIGTASIYFLESFPNARVIAIEPDPGNYEVLCRNLSSYGDRAIPLQMALWSHSAKLSISYGGFRDGGEWSTQVTNVTSVDTHEVQALSVSDLMKQFNFNVIDILKIDIEGAEKEVFTETSQTWLPNVRSIAIELHDEVCRSRFRTATASHGGFYDRDGEVTIWSRESTDQK